MDIRTTSQKRAFIFQMLPTTVVLSSVTMHDILNLPTSRLGGFLTGRGFIFIPHDDGRVHDSVGQKLD